MSAAVLERRIAALAARVAPPPAIPGAVDLARAALGEPDPWQRDVLRSTSPRMLLNCSRQSGKSSTVGVLATHTVLVEANTLVLLVSPTLRQSGELFKKALAVYRGTGRLVAAESETALTLSLANGSRIVSLPGAEGSIRGYSGPRLIAIDEASRVPDDLYLGLRPMLAVSNGRLVALSTPFGTRGWWYEAWRSSEPWTRVQITAEQCPRIGPAFLAEEERTLGPWWYRQEYFGEFMDAQSAAFRSEDVEAAFGREVEQWRL